MKTPTGYMQVSTSEITALDLVRYNKSAGYLSHVATILSELQESFDKKRFEDIFETENLESADMQRLGYLLELVKAEEDFLSLFKQYVKEQKPRFVSLRSDKVFDKANKNIDWHLYINEIIETDN